MLPRLAIGQGNMTVSFFCTGHCFAPRGSLYKLHFGFELPSSTRDLPEWELRSVLTETNGVATTSFGYDVTVEAKGAKKGTNVASLYRAIRNEQAFGVNLRWADDHVLRIQYLRANQS
jgi:hypothetical protein